MSAEVGDGGREQMRRCEHCSEVIGVYEPMIVVSEGVAVRTSGAAISVGGAAPEGSCFHSQCFTELPPG